MPAEVAVSFYDSEAVLPARKLISVLGVHLRDLQDWAGCGQHRIGLDQATRDAFTKAHLLQVSISALTTASAISDALAASKAGT